MKPLQIISQLSGSAGTAVNDRRHRGQRSLGLGRTGCDIFYTEAAQDSELDANWTLVRDRVPAAVPMQD